MSLKFLPWFWVFSLALSLPNSRSYAQGVLEETQFHGRFHLGLAYGSSRTLASCLRLQSPVDFDFGRDDCGEAEGVFLLTRNFLRSVGDQIWARAVIDLRLETNMLRSWSDTYGNGEDALRWSNRNFYVEAGRVLGLDETLWIGNRSYDYEDLWLLDLRLLDQHGPGFGISNLKTPMGPLALAFFRVVSQKGGPTQDTFDVRISRIPLLEGEGKLALIQTSTGAVDASSGEKKYARMQGSQVAFVYQWEDENLLHKWAIQAGQGLYGGTDLTAFDKGRGIALNETGEERDPSFLLKDSPADEREAVKESRSLRLADQISVTPSDKPWAFHAGAAYEWVSFGGLRYQKDELFYKRGDMETIVWALRPAYHWTDNYGLDLQLSDLLIKQGLGFKHVTPDGVEQNHREPVTRRFQRASLGFLVRPLGWGYAELRTYLAYNKWNREIQKDITEGAFSDRSKGITGGMTFQIWW
jgi:maltoporin